MSNTIKQGSLLAWGMCAIASLFYSYEFFLRVMPSVMIPHLMSQHNISAHMVSIISAYYFYAYTPMQLVVGTMIDHYGVRKLLFIAIIVCILGLSYFGFVHSITSAKLGRFLIGFGSAFAFVSVMKIAADWLPNRWFAIVAGLTTTLGMLGAIGGELILSELFDVLGIRITLIFSVCAGCILAVMSWFIVRDAQTKLLAAKPVDKIPALWKDFIKIVTIPQIWLNAAIGLCLYMPTTIFAGLWATEFLVDVKHLSTTHAALLSSMIFAGWAVGAPCMGLLANKLISERYILSLGGLFAAITSILLFFFTINNFGLLLLLLFCFGFFSSAEIIVFAISHKITPQALCATGIALTNMIIMCGGFLQPLVGWLLDSHNIEYISQVHHYSLSQYQHALFIIPVSFILATILPFMLKNKQFA